MPIRPVVASGVRVGVDAHELGIPVNVRRHRMRLKYAEPLAERHLRRRGQLLIAKEDHLMFEQRTVHRTEHDVIERLRQINAAYLRAESGRQRIDTQHGHARSLDLPSAVCVEFTL